MGGIRLFQAMAGAEYGGAEIFFERLALGFHRAGVTQRLAVKPWPQRLELLGGAGIDVKACGFAPVPAFMTRRQLGRMVREFRADVMLTWMNRATHLAPKAGIPHVARLGGFYNLKYYRHCDRLVANTRGIADYLVREGWPQARVHVLGNFTPAPQRHAPGANSFAGAGRRQKNAGGVHFVSLGRFHHNKGFDVLLHAFAAMGNGDARLTIAGEGALRDSLKALADDLGIAGRVRFLPWQKNPQDFMATGDVFVCPSRHEPFGNVIMEAFAMGMPVLATATDAAAEYLTAGENAAVVPCDDAAALADAMGLLAADPRLAASLAKAGHKTWAQGYTEEVVVKQWRAFLESIA